VVLFGLTDGLQQLADNKSIFKNKLVVIDAKSGQVIGLDDSKKPTEKGSRSLALWQKLSLLGTIVLLLGAIIWVYLLIVDDVNTSFLSSNGTSIKTEKNVVSLTQAEFIESNKAITVREMQSKQKASLTDDVSNASAENVYSQATSADITQAILTTSSITNTEMVEAQAGDVLQALFVTDIPKGAELTKLTKQVNSPFEQSMVINNQEEKTNNINGIYYQKKAAEYREGYVIQIAGFTENGLWQKFINQNHNINLYSYQRLLSNKKFTVVTSQVFRNKAEAKAAMALLPATLMERKPWLKPISSVITEINTFTR
jgi:DamX protein